MSEEAQKRLITLLAALIAYAVSDRLADRYLDQPEERGVADDIKEAAIKGSFRFASTVAASFIIRQIISRRWRG